MKVDIGVQEKSLFFIFFSEHCFLLRKCNTNKYNFAQSNEGLVACVIVGTGQYCKFISYML